MKATDLAQRFTRAVNDGDEQEFRRVMAPDATIWHCSDGIDQSVSENLQAQVNLRARLDFQIEIQRLEEITGGYLQQHVMHFRSGAGVYSCLIGTVVNDQIARIEEYLDTTVTASLL